MQIPYRLQAYPAHVQRAWLNEFDRVLERTGSALTADNAADMILTSFTRSTINTEPGGNRSAHNVLMTATIREFTELESRDVIPAGVLGEIKAIDPHPFLVLFKIGTDGVSVGERQRKMWSFRAIKELASRVREKAAIIIGHTKDAAEAAQKKAQKLGEVVWSYTKKAGDSLAAYAVAHVTDPDTQERIRSGELDICSVEGEIELSRKSTLGTWFVDKVRGIDFLALADSSRDKPGFGGAGVVAIIKELESERDTMGKENEQKAEVSIYEVKVAIEKHGWKPGDLFRNDDLLNSEPVKKAVSDAESAVTKEKQTEIDKLTADLKPLQQAAEKNAAADMVTKSSLLTDSSTGVRDYMKDKLSVTDLSNIETSARQAAIDERIKKELEFIKTHGITFGDSKGQTGNEKESQGGDKTGQKTDPNDFTLPDNNELIPKEDE